MNQQHIVIVTVENRPGVLARLTALFAANEFNIVSLTVAPTIEAGMSRISMVVDLSSTTGDAVLEQLAQLPEVVAVAQLGTAGAVQRELLLATVAPTPVDRPYINDLVRSFGAEILAPGHTTVTVCLAGTPEALDSFEMLLQRYNIVEAQRTGRVALPDRGWARRD